MGGGINPEKRCICQTKGNKTHDLHTSLGKPWMKSTFRPTAPSSDTGIWKYTQKSVGETDRVTSVAGYPWRHSSAFRRLPAETAAPSSPPPHRQEVHASKWERRVSGGVRNEREAEEPPPAPQKRVAQSHLRRLYEQHLHYWVLCC